MKTFRLSGTIEYGWELEIDAETREEALKETYELVTGNKNTLVAITAFNDIECEELSNYYD